MTKQMQPSCLDFGLKLVYISLSVVDSSLRITECLQSSVTRMMPSTATTWPSNFLRKLASFLVKLVKSSLHRGRFVLRFLCFLLRRLGSSRVYFDRCTHSAQKPREDLQHVAIHASTSPTVQPDPPTTDDDQPGEQRLHALTAQTNGSLPEHPLHLDTPARFSAVSIGAGGDHQALNPGSRQSPDFPEPSEHRHYSGLGITPRFPEPSEHRHYSGLGIIPRFPEPSVPVPSSLPGVQMPVMAVQHLRHGEPKPIIPTDVKRYERGIKL